MGTYLLVHSVGVKMEFVKFRWRVRDIQISEKVDVPPSPLCRKDFHDIQKKEFVNFTWLDRDILTLDQSNMPCLQLCMWLISFQWYFNSMVFISMEFHFNGISFQWNFISMVFISKVESMVENFHDIQKDRVRVIQWWVREMKIWDKGIAPLAPPCTLNEISV